MLRRFVTLFILFVLMVTAVGTTLAQSSSNVQIFVVLCADRAVMNLSGTMQAGYDLYFQIFPGSQGTGNAITALRQVAVDSTYAFSESVAYNTGAVLPVGQIGSAYVTISREGNPDSSIYDTFVDDVQDGCAQPLNLPSTSTTTEGNAPTGETETAVPTSSDPLAPIMSPYGGVINPGYSPGPASDVVDPNWKPPRQQTPGLIFAECDRYRMAEPGIIYDTDEVTIFWSWYASTQELAQEHMNAAQYSVRYFESLFLPYVIESEIQKIGRNYWVFYYSPLGHLRPGHYHISYQVTWARAISDGYEEFGPGTANEVLTGDCSFDILPNPDGTPVQHNIWPHYNQW